MDDERGRQAEMTSWVDVADAADGGITPLLPQSVELIEAMRASGEVEETEGVTETGVAHYVARPEASGPHLRFHVLEADGTLLRLVGRAEAGFEVLDVYRAGLQYHWRSDLARAYDEQAPIFGRMYATSGARELIIEHLAVPMLVRHRVREVRGWFAFEPDLADDLDTTGGLTMVRRPLRSSHVRPLGATPLDLRSDDGAKGGRGRLSRWSKLIGRQDR